MILTVLNILGFEKIIFEKIFWLFALARGFTDCFAESYKMKALIDGDLSVVSSLQTLSIVFTLIFSSYVGGDSYVLSQFVGVTILVIGNFVILLNPSAKFTKESIIYSLISCLFFGLNHTFDRMCALLSTPVYSAFAVNLVSLALLAPLVLIKRNNLIQVSANYKVFFGRGFFESLQMSFKMFALQGLQTVEYSAISRISLFLNLLTGRFMFKELGFMRRFLGISLIVCGLLLILFKPKL